MAVPALPAEVEKLLKDQAPSSRSRTNYFDPSVFASRHGRPYSSRRIPIETLMEMRTDAIMRFAQLVALVSIFTSKWKIECANAQKASFVDNALRRIIGRLIIQYFESWNFGWQALVKEFGLMNPGWQYVDPKSGKSAPVWDEGGYPALVWEPFVTLRPQSVAPVWSASGTFNGIAIAKSGVQGGYALPTIPFAPGDTLGIDHPLDISSFFNDQDEAKTKVDVEHSLWVTNERDAQFGSIWGYPRLGYAYKYWWAYEMTFGILQRAVERHGDPTVVVAYPMGSSSVAGVETPNQVIAFQIAEKARSGSVLAVPSEVWGEDMATANQASKWEIKYLKPDADFDKLVRVLEYYDTMRFRSMMVSELAIAEGSGGTSSRNVAAETGQRTAESQVFAQAELDEVINRYMIPQLADANFPELRDEPARKVTQAFGQDEAQLAADMLRSYANSDAEKLPIDKPALMRQFQVPTLEGAELDKWQRELAKRAEQQSKPQPEVAKPGGPAGVTDTGFYYQAPESIQLAEDETFLAALPKSRHYSDRAVLAQTRAVRKLWKDALVKQYEDFAEHVSKSDVSLADEDPAGTAADRIMKAWRFSYAGVVKKMAVALTKVLARAGRLELGSSRLKGDGWDPESKTVSDWVRANAATAIRSIDETTRDQLRTFLANEIVAGNKPSVIAANVRAHFSGFPDWRADLIAREETKRYYNAGTLFAAEAVGAVQVQALDGQAGPTDPECEARNGQLFEIPDAWRESEKEHVRGTLSWRIVPGETPLSFSRSSSTEMGEVAARFDRDERVIYLVEGLDSAAEGRYLEQLVDSLVSA